MIIPLISKAQIATFLSCLLMASLLLSPFLLSLSMMGLLILGLLNLDQIDGRYRLSLNKDLLVRLRDARKYLSFFVIPLFFFIVLLSFWQTIGDSSYFLERLRIKLPFLILPVAFLGLPPFSKRQVNLLLFFLLLFVTICSLGVGINYAIHFDAINAKLGRGQTMTTPGNHIRFSILTAVSIIGGIYLIVENYYWKRKFERILIKGLTFYLFVFIHLLSVKSGILCLYVALGILIGRYMYLSKKYMIGISALLIIPIIFMLAFSTMPSFKQKINYMIYDYQQYAKGAGGQYADAGRTTSLKAGYELFMQAPLFGTGAGNLRWKIKELYKEKYDDYISPLMPHNQFLFVLAGTGLFGFSFFLIAFLVPLFHRNAYRHHFFLGFYMIFLGAFMIEHTIESAVGVGTFIFFLLLILNSEME